MNGFLGSIVKIVRGQVKLVGATDSTKIGNVGDKLKVALSDQQGALFSNKLCYEDMNASTGGVARGTGITGTSFTQVYSYSGSGLVLGFLISLQSMSDWTVKLEVDSQNVFCSSGIDLHDLTETNLYGFGDNQASSLGLSRSGSVFHFESVRPITYSSTVKVYAAPDSPATKNFQAGLIALTKET